MQAINFIQTLMMLSVGVALGACATQSAQSERLTVGDILPAFPKWGWSCTGRFKVEGRRVTIWREFEASGTIRPYQIQTFASRPNGTYWTIDPRPDGPPASEPISWETGRSEGDVLRDGPDYVQISYSWHTRVVGPVHVYFWADEKYAGSERLFSAKQVRRLTDKDGMMGGLSSGLSKGQIMQSLYGSQTWSYKVTDATGKELTVGAFRPPDLASSIAEYRQVRADIERLELEFRADFQRKAKGSTICEANADPSTTI